MHGAFDVILYFVNPTYSCNKLCSYLILSYLIITTSPRTCPVAQHTCHVASIIMTSLRTCPVAQHRCHVACIITTSPRTCPVAQHTCHVACIIMTSPRTCPVAQHTCPVCAILTTFTSRQVHCLFIPITCPDTANDDSDPSKRTLELGN